MSETTEPEKTKVRVPWWLWLGSAVWLVAVFSIAWFIFWPNLEKQTPPGLKPNEFGDLLAGAFSPLAFAWFVYAVFMQREELELQRKELKQSRDVMKDQKEELKKSADNSKKLFDISLKNLEHSLKKTNIELFDILYKNLLNYFKDISGIKFNTNSNYISNVVFIWKDSTKFVTRIEIKGRCDEIIYLLSSEKFKIENDENVRRLERTIFLLNEIRKISENEKTDFVNKIRFESLELNITLTALEELHMCICKNSS